MHRKPRLAGLSTAEIVARYEEVAIEVATWFDAGNVRRSNRAVEALEEMYAELSSRGPDAQRALAPLLRHSHPQVRLSAGVRALEFDPRAGRRVLKKLAREGGRAALHAGMLLDLWRKGMLNFQRNVDAPVPAVAVAPNAVESSTPESVAPTYPSIPALVRQCIGIIGRPETDDRRSAPRSRIGGHPDLPVGFAWPEWDGEPLAFLAQLALDELPESDVSRDLPSTGVLSFFYDSAQRTWGFDPKDRGSWRVYYFPDARSLRTTAAPEEALTFTAVPVTFRESTTLASPTSPEYEEADLSEEEADEYETLLEDHWTHVEVTTSHHLLGFADDIQGRMELEVQLASNGVYTGGPDGYDEELAAALASGARDWRLLLQLDSDPSTGMEWGDNGRLYFWIRRDDLERGEFDDVWMVLQCY